MLKEVIDEFYRRDPSGNVDKIYQEIVRDAPGIKQAQPKVVSAQHDLVHLANAGIDRALYSG